MYEKEGGVGLRGKAGKGKRGKGRGEIWGLSEKCSCLTLVLKSLDQISFSRSAPLAFWTRSLFVEGHHPWPRMHPILPGLTTSIFRHCQMYPKEQNHPHLTTTGTEHKISNLSKHIQKIFLNLYILNNSDINYLPCPQGECTRGYTDILHSHCWTIRQQQGF